LRNRDAVSCEGRGAADRDQDVSADTPHYFLNRDAAGRRLLNGVRRPAATPAVIRQADGSE